MTRYIYFIENHDGQYVKIGRSYSPIARAFALRGYAFKLFKNKDLNIVAAMAEGYPTEEGDFHRLFAAQRFAGEWFRFSEEIRTFIQSVSHRHIPLDQLPEEYTGTVSLQRESVIITAKVPESVWRELKKEAEERGMKFGAFIAFVLTQHVNESKSKVAPVAGW